MEQLLPALDTPHRFIVSLYSYKDLAVKKTIHAIKYHHRRDLIPSFATRIADEIPASYIHTSIIIPIPMPSYRKYLRGYNQAELLAKEIAHITHLPMYTHILTRKKAPRRQVITRSRRERLQNQHGTFIVQQPLKGQSVILIDDVTTTGATLYTAREELLKSGASEVLAFTIAH
ncbi:MAG: hypothetical protein RLZZ308_273 [Candidatus Parcubacteria bacterium]|jgi:ComF family protein